MRGAATVRSLGGGGMVAVLQCAICLTSIVANMTTPSLALSDATPFPLQSSPVLPDSIRAGWFGLDEHVVDGYEVWPFHDRRWYPREDAGNWAHVTRQLMFESIQRCVAHAVGASRSGSLAPHEPYASDQVFRHLHVCASECARELYKLGQDGDRAVAFILAGAVAAAEPDTLHPAVLRAIADWCRDAQGATPADALSRPVDL